MLGLESENTIADAYLKKYGALVRELSKFIPYFESKGSKDVAVPYDGKYGESSLKFPVFDSTLLSFVKKVSGSPLADRNYAYVYSRYHIRTHDDERDFINKSGIRDIDALRGIMSKYVLEGMHKATRWGEAVENRIFYMVLIKLKELMDFYQKKA